MSGRTFPPAVSAAARVSSSKTSRSRMSARKTAAWPMPICALIAAHRMEAKAFALTVRRIEEEAKAGKGVGPAVSIIKYAAAKINQDRCELMVEAMGSQGLGWEGEGFKPSEIAATRGWL